MTRPVSIVLPSLGTIELLRDNLPPLLDELERRSLGDEAIVVDDTGENKLAPWLAENFPSVHAVSRAANGGFAQALLSGVEAARHELVFSLNTDVRVRPGFLDPLVACLEDDVFAVVPRVLLNGEESQVESLTRISWADGFASLDQPGLKLDKERQPFRPVPIAFAVGGTVLFRRDEFLARKGFDPLFEPFYWEDVDLCWSAWRSGRRVLYQPASVVEHHHRGTIGRFVDSKFVRAAIEKNRLLFQWKHLDVPEALIEHVAALYRTAFDGWTGDMREELVWLNLALEQVDEVLAARRAEGSSERDFEAIRREANADE